MAVIVEVLNEEQQIASTDISGSVVEVLHNIESPITTIDGVSVVESVAPGGSVANVAWGYDFPLNPTEGQIFIKITP